MAKETKHQSEDQAVAFLKHACQLPLLSLDGKMRSMLSSLFSSADAEAQTTELTNKSKAVAAEIKTLQEELAALATWVVNREDALKACKNELEPLSLTNLARIGEQSVKSSQTLLSSAILVQVSKSVPAHIAAIESACQERKTLLARLKVLIEEQEKQVSEVLSCAAPLKERYETASKALEQALEEKKQRETELTAKQLILRSIEEQLALLRKRTALALDLSRSLTDTAILDKKISELAHVSERLLPTFVRSAETRRKTNPVVFWACNAGFAPPIQESLFDSINQFPPLAEELNIRFEERNFKTEDRKTPAISADSLTLLFYKFESIRVPWEDMVEFVASAGSQGQKVLCIAQREEDHDRLTAAPQPGPHELPSSLNVVCVRSRFRLKSALSS
jgi:cell division protein FtsB